MSIVTLKFVDIDKILTTDPDLIPKPQERFKFTIKIYRKICFKIYHMMQTSSDNLNTMATRQIMGPQEGFKV